MELTYAKPAPTSMRLSSLRNVGPATSVCTAGEVRLMGHGPCNSK